MRRQPLIGVTCDVETVGDGVWRARVGGAYLQAVTRAGGVPVVLHPDPGLAEAYAAECDGVVLTGGPDVDVRRWGLELHGAAQVMHAVRQEFELALLGALERRRQRAVLGVCLGMQMMGVARAGGGALIQHLPDEVGDAAGAHTRQRGDALHGLTVTAAWDKGVLAGLGVDGHVASHHHQGVRAQAVAAAGLRPLAVAEAGVLEAFDDPSRPFYLGVQWHPERTADPALGQGVFDRLVAAARSAGP